MTNSIKLHTCPLTWLKIPRHPCWTVQKALDEAGIPYEVVKQPLRSSRRNELEQLTGQRALPAIHFADGSTYRAESKEMAERIRAGRLFADST
jgi:glutaredoxin